MSEVKTDSFIVPNWPVPAWVKAISTTRLHGFSTGVYASLNLGLHVGDDAAIVQANRQKLRQDINLPSDPLWLNQIHSNQVVYAGDIKNTVDADASFTDKPKQVCVVMTADCLPVLFANESGTKVAAAHAGWRGLLDGILEHTVEKLAQNGERIFAWFGPAIGPSAFEVGEEVVSAFVERDVNVESAFQRLDTRDSRDKWLANIYQLANKRLKALGVNDIYGGEYCTYSDKKRFYSYRRDGICGRMASLIWLDK